jgi:YfiH family protein
MDAVFPSALGATDLRHGFFTRRGGVSRGIYDSLNCGFGSQDDRDHVAANRRRVTDAVDLLPDALATVHQQHTSTVVTVDANWQIEQRPIADAMVTARPRVGLGILTADCAPVLFADAEAGVIGAAHAGWRGARGGVIANTVAAMLRLGARLDRIRAAVGPCIGQNSYQVGDEFVAAFVRDDPGHDRFFSAPDDEGKRHFDLPGFARDCLLRAGIAGIDMQAPDTCVDEDRFFSFRRTTHRKEGDYGRQIAVIALAHS